MSVTYYGPARFFYGAVNKDLPKLPEGFRYEQHPKNWVTATDGHREYYVTKDALIRMRFTTPDDVRRTNGRLKLRDPWVDTTDTIPLECTPAN